MLVRDIRSTGRVELTVQLLLRCSIFRIVVCCVIAYMGASEEKKVK